MLAKMIAFAATKFERTVDKAGKPYILHCLRVMKNLHTDDEELNCIAVGHDLIEDFEDVTVESLIFMGFSERVVNGISILSHKKDEDYDTYIKRIAHFPDCVKVKLSDLKDNSNITRLKGLGKKDFDRMEKYHRSYIYLSQL